MLIADDHQLMGAAVRRALAGEEDIEIVADARDGAAVLPLVDETRPDVIVLDVEMPHMDGLTCLSRVRTSFPEAVVLMLSASTDPGDVADARRRGARGYVAKTATPADLASALRRALQPGDFLTYGVGDRVSAGGGLDALSEREGVVLAAVSRGLSNRQIARELWVTEQTVKFHLRNIFRKLGVSNRADAARCAAGQPDFAA